MPRSKPSMTTYIMMPKRMMTAQISGKVDTHVSSCLRCRAVAERVDPFGCGRQRPHRLSCLARTAVDRRIAFVDLRALAIRRST